MDKYAQLLNQNLEHMTCAQRVVRRARGERVPHTCAASLPYIVLTLIVFCTRSSFR